MKAKTFKKIVNNQVGLCKTVLLKKADEYASHDRLHNFKVAAALQCEEPKQVLAGMMAKHTVSIFDMCRSKKDYPLEMWEEKITDHINYLLLLKALIEEDIFLKQRPESEFDKSLAEEVCAIISKFEKTVVKR